MCLKSISMVLLAIAVIAATEAICPDGYTTKDNRVCYKVYNFRATRYSASVYCANDGGYLASIPTALDDGYLLSLSNDSIWLGLTCRNGENSCKNDDGTVFGSYRNFYSRESFQAGSCIYKDISSTSSYSTWMSARCEDAKAFACELPVGSICPVNYTFWRGSCYRIVVDGASEIDAVANCQTEGAQLASIHSDAENTYLLNAADTPKKFAFMRIGLQADTSTFANYWLDGSLLNYTSKIGYSDTNVGVCYGMAMIDRLVPRGSWSSVNCEAEMGYICKAGKSFGDKKLMAPLQCNSSQELTTESGVIYSPGYPLPYVRSDCIYFITVDDDLIVEASFPVLNLANGTTIILSNDMTGGPHLAVITAQNTSVPTIKSEFNQLVVEFKFNDDVAEPLTKWQLKYQAAKEVV